MIPEREVQAVLARMVTPAVMLPIQLTGERALSPEQRLMRSLLEDAFACLDLAAAMKGVSGDVARRARRRGNFDMAWFESDDVDWPFSFLRVCEQLEMSVSATRLFARRLIAGEVRYSRVNRVSGTRTKMGGRGAA